MLAPLDFVAAFFRRDVIFQPVVRANRALVGIRSILHAVDHVGLECLPFFNELLDARAASAQSSPA